jgi:hypothetical protein
MLVCCFEPEKHQLALSESIGSPRVGQDHLTTIRVVSRSPKHLSPDCKSPGKSLTTIMGIWWQTPTPLSSRLKPQNSNAGWLPATGRDIRGVSGHTSKSHCPFRPRPRELAGNPLLLDTVALILGDEALDTS